MTDLAGWLLEQIAADEEQVKADSGLHTHQCSGWVYPDTFDVLDHDCRFGEARILAECEAKRRIVEVNRFWVEHSPVVTSYDFNAGSRELAGNTLALLALPYADRPGYGEEWRP